MMEQDQDYEIGSILKLTKDLKAAAQVLSHQEARYLVDTYYQIQKFRKSTNNQVLQLTKSEEPNEMIKWFLSNTAVLEKEIKKALGLYLSKHPMGKWFDSVLGVGPVLGCGLVAHIDIRKCPTAGHIYSFAGLDPTREWLGADKSKKLIDDVIGKTKTITQDHLAELSQKSKWSMEYLNKAANDEGKIKKSELVKLMSFRPWNAKLKVVCWLIGQQFVKVHNNPKALYGKLYAEKKSYYNEKNNAGEYAERAATILASKNFSKATEAYKAYSQGKLPAGHIQSMAERYAVKMFLSHMHEIWYKLEFGKEPPKPFAISILNHAHYIPPDEF